MTDIKVLVIEPGKKPEIRTIDDGLKSMQEIVGGDIEPVPLGKGSTLWCNEDGIAKGLPSNNRIVRDDRTSAATGRNGGPGPVAVLRGTVLISGTNAKGRSVSLSDADAERYSRMFAESEERDVDGDRKTTDKTR